MCHWLLSGRPGSCRSTIVPIPSRQEADRVQSQAYMWVKDAPGPLAPPEQVFRKGLGFHLLLDFAEGVPSANLPVKVLQMPHSFCRETWKAQPNSLSHQGIRFFNGAGNSRKPKSTSRKRPNLYPP